MRSNQPPILKIKKSELHFLTKQYYSPKKTITETKSSELCTVNKDDLKWFSGFYCDRTSTDDAERSGGHKNVSIPENVGKIHDIMLNNPKVKLRKLAETTKMSNSNLFNNVMKKKLSATRAAFANNLPKTN